MLPNIAGIPWWGAVVLAVTTTAIGFAYDAGTGDKELSAFFAFCYVAGCVLAVLAVRRSGIFTAVIQPPLILFVTVPFAYFLFHSDKIGGIKDLLINCGYPLIERFPMMFFTALAVLALGLLRWFVLPRFQTATDDDEADDVVADAKPRRARRQTAEDDEEVAAGGLAATLSAKLTKLTTGKTPRSTRTRASRRPTHADAADASRRSSTDSLRRAAVDAQRRADADAAHSPRPARSGRSRGDTEFIDPVPGQIRRPQRPARPRPAATDPYGVPDEPRRRPRAAEPRRTPPPDRHEYREPRARYDQPQTPQTPQRPVASEPHRNDPPRRRQYADDPYEPVDRYQTPAPARPSRNAGPASGSPRSSATGAPTGARHPVSRVRYRGAEDDAAAPEPRPERRPRQHRRDADSWEYDG